MTYRKKSAKNPSLVKNPRTISEALNMDRVDKPYLMLNMLTLNMDRKVALLPSLEKEISLDPSRRPEPSIKMLNGDVKGGRKFPKNLPVCYVGTHFFKIQNT